MTAKSKASDREMGDQGRVARAERSREVTAAASEIGSIPPIKNPERRAACERDLFLFLTTYFPASTGLKPFSDDHKRVIDRLQYCILVGGRFVNAVYRGFAKTTISENTALWAELYGHKKFIPIFGADRTAASDMIDSIKMELSENDLLYEDFPEVCHAIRALEGKVQRCNSQTQNGELTHIGWTADEIVLPTITLPAGYFGEGSKPRLSDGSGAIVRAKGLTAASRGMKFKRPDGTQARPDFVIIDDPQTDESAASPLQVNQRHKVIRKAILRGGGHFSDLAVVVNATVIAKNDLIEILLDQKQSPSWQGERIPMVSSFSNAHDTMWLENYAGIRNAFNNDVPGDQARAHGEATAYYEENREAMDDGCVVSWEHCFAEEKQEVSAIQHAYNILIDDGPEVFASECQNEPLVEESDGIRLTAAEIAEKKNGFKRLVVPNACDTITAKIDVHQDVLYYAIIAWENYFTGYVIDYGTYPDQKRSYFSLKDAKITMSMMAPKIGGRGAGLDGIIYAGLEACSEHILGREYKRDDGAAMRVARCDIDANWGQYTDLVYLFCRQSKYAGIVQPSHGKGVGPNDQPLGLANQKVRTKQSKRKESPGLNLEVRTGRTRAVRHVLFDTNYWKSFVHTRFATAMGDIGCLSLWGGANTSHTLFSEHQLAEKPTTTEAKGGRTVDVWTQLPNRPDNHWFDCIVGCCVQASIAGIRLHDAARAPREKREKLSLSELQAKKRQQGGTKVRR